jgi:hypothetical protein
MSDDSHIPLATDLVSPGDPVLKAKAKHKNLETSQLDELNLRIDDIETAIGQNESDPVGRSYAIRAEEQVLDS